ncbi:MAG TPA: DUF1049 domain-containing protein [Syntrophobacteraceae bacterium]|nr:DUF1049 domain-containing protein [Syntrophobacteraceae bacterium]
MVFTLIVAVAIAILATIFALQNPVMVQANLLGYKVDGSLALFVLVGLGIGLLIGILVMTPGRIKSSFANSRHRRKIVELESSIQQIKPVPSMPPVAQKPSAPVSALDENPKNTP